MSHFTAARQVDPIGCGRKIKVAGFFCSSFMRCAREMALPVCNIFQAGDGIRDVPEYGSSGASGAAGAAWREPSGSPTPAADTFMDQGMA